MGYRTAFKEVMREYERDREISQARLEEKRRAVYIQVPRIAEIERQLKLIGLKFAREILSHNSENINPDPKRELSELIAEKKHLLAENSFGTDYLNLEYKCNICQDTGFVDNKRCVCLKQRLADKYYNLSDLKKTLKNEHFGTFNLKCYADKTGAEGISPRDKMKVILKTSKEFTSKFMKKEISTNLLFYGYPGLGKTFLCNCIAKELLENGFTVLYNTAPHLFKAIEDCRFNRASATDSELIDTLMDVDLLIIDDLGSEISTIITNSEFFNILNTRLLDNRSIVISTNLKLEELEKQYSERIISRFIGRFIMLKFIGDDIRTNLKYNKSLS